MSDDHRCCECGKRLSIDYAATICVPCEIGYGPGLYRLLLEDKPWKCPECSGELFRYGRDGRHHCDGCKNIFVESHKARIKFGGRA